VFGLVDYPHTAGAETSDDAVAWVTAKLGWGFVVDGRIRLRRRGGAGVWRRPGLSQEQHEPVVANRGECPTTGRAAGDVRFNGGVFRRVELPQAKGLEVRATDVYWFGL
jgi:hypothetical protein